jgi:DNA polymerase
MTPYQKHVRKWKNCTRCQLCRQRKRVVLGRGSLPAPILFIGEAPGASEDILGLPFVGPAGKLLDSIIERSVNGLFALTNLVACYPREAKKAGTNEPPKEAIKACRERLEEFATLCNPKVIILVGKLADRYWLGGLSIYRLPKAKIYHPASILRIDDPNSQALAIKKCVVTIENALKGLEGGDA